MTYDIYVKIFTRITTYNRTNSPAATRFALIDFSDDFLTNQLAYNLKSHKWSWIANVHVAEIT